MSSQHQVESVDANGRELEELPVRVDTISNGLAHANRQIEDLQESLEEICAENEQLRDRVETLERRLASIDETCDSRESKVRAIVRKAQNLRQEGQKGVALTPRDVKGATGVSRRWSYTLCDAEEGLPAEYEWILSRDEARKQIYGHLEIDGQTQRTGIIIDFEALHNDREAVNRFITDHSQEGA